MALSTLGPGATNLTTAAAYAFLGAFPMLMITGQKPVLKSKQARRPSAWDCSAAAGRGSASPVVTGHPQLWAG